MTEHDQTEGESQSHKSERQPRHAVIKAFILRQFGVVQNYIREAQRRYKKQQQSERSYPGNELRYYLAGKWAKRYDYWRDVRAAWNVERGMLAFTGILTIATILAWITMVRQNNIMLGQMAQTDETLAQMRYAQRAWVGIENVLLSTPIKKGFEFALIVKNVGDSPALVDGVHSIFIFFKADDATIADAARSNRAQPPDGIEEVLAPGLSAAIPCGSNGAVITEEIAKDIVSGSRPAIIVGVIYYHDTLGTKGSTEFCLQYDVPTQSLRSYGKHSRMNQRNAVASHVSPLSLRVSAARP